MQACVSIILSVTNTSMLQRCLRSLRIQKNKKFELLHLIPEKIQVIEKLVASYRGDFPNMACIIHESPPESLDSQLTGMGKAVGEYIIFLNDASWLDPHVTGEIIRAMAAEHPDCISFPVHIIDQGNPALATAASPPYATSFEHFTAHAYTFGLQGYCFSRKIVENILKHKSELSYLSDHSQNNILLGAILHDNVSTCIESNIPWYIEKEENTPLSFTGIFDQDEFTRFCDTVTHTEAQLGELAEKNLLSETNGQYFINTRQDIMLKDIVPTITRFPLQIASERFTRLLHCIPASKLADRLYRDHFEVFARALAALPPKHKTPSIRHVALFIPTLGESGAELSAVILGEILLDHGYGVSFFTDSPPEPSDYAYDRSRMQRYVLPATIEERWNFIQNSIEELQIDLCLCFNHWNKLGLLDMTAASQTQSYCLAMERNMFFFPLYSGKPALAQERKAAYALVDGITCLTEFDAILWNNSGFQNIFICPRTTRLAKILPEKDKKTSRTILFVGKVGRPKGALYLPYILSSIRQQIPDAELVCVGHVLPAPLYHTINQICSQLSLGAALKLVGHVLDISEYFNSARVHIMPSLYEGAPNVLREAKRYGVPSVIFGMPYLEYTAEEQGTVMVGKRDIQGMADAVIRLLEDDDHWSVMSEWAKRALAESDGPSAIMAQWENIFARLVSKSATLNERKAVDREFMDIAMQELVSAVANL